MAIKKKPLGSKNHSNYKHKVTSSLIEYPIN